MPRVPPLDDEDEETVLEFFATRKRLDHLRVRRRADLLTVESGPKTDPVRHARFRRVTVHYWTLECATHTDRWEKTGLRAPLEQLLAVLTSDFAWVLAPVV